MSAHELTGRAAPPMANGEVVFESPWQGRVFGMAAALAQAGVFPWSAFQAQLIAEIERAPDNDEPYAYFDHFQAALEALLQQSGVVSEPGLDAMTAALAARPHGHDH